MNLLQDITGKIAVVTGAGSGIGRALALACAHEGMRVALLDLRRPGLDETAALLPVRDGAPRPLILEVDVTQEAAVEKAADDVYTHFGAVHLLFNNAGVFAGGAPWKVSMQEWRWQFDVNVMGIAHMLRSFIPRMLSAGQPGHIVNTSSAGGLTSPPGFSVYSATKHAIVGLSECLYHDLVAEGAKIGVSVLCPAFVKTALVDQRDAPILNPEVDALYAATRKAMENARLTADDVARITLDAVKTGRFYILPHGAVRAGIQRRMQDILEDRTPTNPLGGGAASPTRGGPR